MSKVFFCNKKKCDICSSDDCYLTEDENFKTDSPDENDILELEEFIGRVRRLNPQITSTDRFKALEELVNNFK